MIVVADASVLVAELLRERGRELLAHPELGVVVAKEQWDEAQHELRRRLAAMMDQGRLTAKQAQQLAEDANQLIENRTIEVIPHAFYGHTETVARRRIPRDPDDWPVVAHLLWCSTPAS